MNDGCGMRLKPLMLTTGWCRGSVPLRLCIFTNPVAAMDDGKIIVGLIEPPPIKDGGPVPELLIDDDCGINKVEDV